MNCSGLIDRPNYDRRNYDGPNYNGPKQLNQGVTPHVKLRKVSCRSWL